MEVTKINLKINNSAAQKPNGQNVFSSNPFGVSFKGQVIQSDVFDNSSKKRISASALVGNINNFNSMLKSRMNSVVSFGQKVKSNVTDFINKARNTEITIDFQSFKETISNKVFPNRQYSVKNLMSKPVDELGNMLRAELAL